LQKALDAQRVAPGLRIGEMFRRMQFAREADVTAGLAVQWSCPVMRMLPSPPTECAIPMEILRRFTMVPAYYSRTKSMLHLAFVDAIDYRAVIAAERMLNCKAEVCLTTRSALEDALEQLEERKLPNEKMFANLPQVEDVIRIVLNYVQQLRAHEVRAVNCGNLFWAKILGHASAVDLLFSRAESPASGVGSSEFGERALPFSSCSSQLLPPSLQI
jgi:hypothetical protein